MRTLIKSAHLSLNFCETGKRRIFVRVCYNTNKKKSFLKVFACPTFTVTKTFPARIKLYKLGSDLFHKTYD